LAELSLLQHDPLTVARLRDALTPSHRIRAFGSWTALEGGLQGSEVDACIVDADLPSRAEAMERMERLQLRHPTVGLVAFGDFGRATADVFRLGQLGVDGLVAAHSEDDAARVRDAVERSLTAARARRCAHLLKGRLDARGIRAVAWCVEHAPDAPRVPELAEAMATQPRRLASRLDGWGLPHPGRLLIWGRLLLAGALLARDGRTVEEAAYGVGYASASGLTRAMKREADATPGAMAKEGGLDEVHRRLFGGQGARRGRGGILRLLTVLLAVLLPLTACAGAPAAPPGPTPAGLLAEPPLDRVHLGVHVVEAATGRVVLSRNADRKFIPASNQKVLTTAAALDRWGPDHRFETALWAQGEVVGDTLAGDLVLAGSGDPTLSDRYHPSVQAALEALADSVRSAGVRRIRGRLVVDVTVWDSASVPGDWEVGDLTWSYGATGGAFAVGEGVVRAAVQGGTHPGEPARLLAWWPRGDPSFLRADLTTLPEDSSDTVRPFYLPESRALLLRGGVPAGQVDTLRMAVRDPVRQAAAALGRALASRGVRVEGGVNVRWPEEGAVDDPCAPPGEGCPGARRVAALTSPSLLTIAQGILEPSQNWMAEQLLAALGAHQAGETEEGTRERGRAAVRAYVLGLGADSMDVDPGDGSGLSVRNLVTPRALVRVLADMRSRPFGAGYRDALAEPGEEDSTLEDRLPTLSGRLFAKTGTISNVDALSGYLVREDGTELIFSILSNGSGLPSRVVRTAVDEVVEALARDTR